MKSKDIDLNHSEQIESLRMEVTIDRMGKGVSLNSFIAISKNILEFLQPQLSSKKSLFALL